MAKVKLASDAPEGAGHISLAGDDYDAPFETYDTDVIQFALNHSWFEVENVDDPDPKLVEEAKKAADTPEEETVRVKASDADVAKTLVVPAAEAESIKERRSEVKDAIK